MASAMLEVALAQPLKPEEVDDEIITVGGVDLGFIMAGDPPHVLSVEPGAELGKRGVQTHDILAFIDGRDTRTVARSEVTALLAAAKRLSFESAKGNIGSSSVDEVDFQADDEPGAEANGATTQTPDKAEEKSTPAAAAPAAAAAAPTAAKAAIKLCSGMMVRLGGFASPTMNGAKGRLGKFSEKQGSWQVFLDQETKAKAVKPKNLDVIIGPDGKPEWAPGYAPAPAPAAAPSADGGRGAAAAWATAALQAAAAASIDVDKMLPREDEHDGWVELMRDTMMKQMRKDAEYPEPPTFYRAHDHAAKGSEQPIPDGKYPGGALRVQLQFLTRQRALLDVSKPDKPDFADSRPGPYGGGYGGGYGGYGGGKGYDKWQPRYGGGGRQYGFGPRKGAPKVVGPPPAGTLPPAGGAPAEGAPAPAEG